MSYTKRKCDFCKKEYMADNRNLKRGWGLCCSKKCAAKKREKNKSSYNPKIVHYNNLKRAGLLPRRIEHTIDDYNKDWGDNDQWGDCDLGIHD